MSAGFSWRETWTWYLSAPTSRYGPSVSAWVRVGCWLPQAARQPARSRHSAAITGARRRLGLTARAVYPRASAGRDAGAGAAHLAVLEDRTQPTQCLGVLAAQPRPGAERLEQPIRPRGRLGLGG